jgi:capsular polysaccharide transport system permease protein
VNAPASLAYSPPPAASLSRRFRVQCGVIGALIMRELHTRYGRENIGYLWLILEPMMLATAIGLIHSKTSTRYGSGIGPVPFSVLGYTMFMMLRSIVTRSEGAIEANGPLFNHRNVTLFDVLCSRALLEAASTILAMAILEGLCMSLGLADPPARPLFLILGMVAMFLLSMGLSMVVAGVTHDNRGIGRLVHPLMYLMMPTSAVFFTMQIIPDPLRYYLGFVPFTHVFELLRYGFFRGAGSDFIDVGYLVSWIAGSWLLGLCLIAVVRKHIHLN